MGSVTIIYCKFTAESIAEKNGKQFDAVMSKENLGERVRLTYLLGN